MKRFIFLLLIITAVAGGSYYYFRLEKNKEMDHTLVLYGNVDVRQVDLAFRVNGRINSLHFDEGDLVSQGALIATLENQPYQDLLLQAEAARESTQISLTNASSVVNRRTALISDGGVSKEDRENALTTQNIYAANLKEADAAIGVANKNLQDTQLTSPSDGIILTRIRELGSVVNPSDPVYTMSLISPVWIRAYVFEQELGNVYVGMKADIYTDTPGAPIYKGRIGFISTVSEFTPKTVETTQLRTDLVYRIRVYADNPDWRLKQGMPVTVKLDLQQGHPSE